MIRRTYHKPDVHCAAEGCTVIVGRGKMFCKDHYFALPKGLRDDLWTAWRAAMDARRECRPRLEQSETNADYQRAYQACRDYLRDAPTTDAASMSAIAYDARDFADAQISGGAPKTFHYVEGRRL